MLAFYMIVCRGEPQTRHLYWVRDFDFMLNLFSLPSPCQLPVPETDSLPPTLVVPSEPFTCKQLKNQSLATATIPHRFGPSVYSKLKYVECTKYVRVQAWIRACKQSVYDVCVPGLFIKLIVIVMVMFYLHPYQSSTRTGAIELPFLLRW